MSFESAGTGGAISRPHRLAQRNLQQVTLDRGHEKLVLKFQDLHDVLLVESDFDLARNSTHATDHPG